MEKKLKCKMSTFQTTMTFNEWAEHFKVGSKYDEPTNHYQGNANNENIIEFYQTQKSPSIFRQIINLFINN